MAGSTRLEGMVVDHCNRARVQASVRYDNMAVGCSVMWCDDGIFGDVQASGMNGRQTFGNGTAGTALVVIGSRRTTFGRIASTDNYQPVLYFSVAQDSKGISSEERRGGNQYVSTCKLK